MAERARGWATTAITLLGVAAITGGILISGGPGQGRAERRDDQRDSDLQALEQQIICLAQERKVLSAEIATTEPCPDTPRTSDPSTGEPYRIEQIDAENIRLCAKFETEAVRQGRSDLGIEGSSDGQGCRILNLPDARYLPAD